MVNTRRIASAVLAGLTLGACILGFVSSARALSTSDKPASILVWPKIIVDTSAVITGGLTDGRPTDTIIELANVDSAVPKQAHCFYINANSHCSELAAQPGKVCVSSSDCPLPGTSPSGNAQCVPGWSEIDFDVKITPEQPLAWRASVGISMNAFPLPQAGICSNHPDTPCNPSSSINTCGGSGTCVQVPSNAGSGIPPTPEDPFFGTLKCIQFDPQSNPPAPDQGPTANRLIGAALIEEIGSNGVDLERYNAVGATLLSNQTDHPGQVQLDGVQYSSCPSTLILNHIFDGAPDPLAQSGDGTGVFTDLTLVPCGDDFLRQDPGTATAQFLVFNEFEQRLSTSRKVDCFFERQLSLIDTNTSNRSIFSFNVQGTLVGQTRIRGVGNAPTGHGLLGVALTDIDGSGVGYNLQQSGNNTGIDIITIP